MRLAEVVLAVLALLLPAGEWLVLLALVPVSVFRGLALRGRSGWRVAREADAVRVSRGPVERRIPLADIRRMRWAFNDNWTDSRIVEDALSLYGERGRLVKIPASGEGFAQLHHQLRHTVPEESVEVSAPAYLD